MAQVVVLASIACFTLATANEMGNLSLDSTHAQIRSPSQHETRHGIQQAHDSREIQGNTPVEKIKKGRNVSGRSGMLAEGYTFKDSEYDINKIEHQFITNNLSTYPISSVQVENTVINTTTIPEIPPQQKDSILELERISEINDEIPQTNFSLIKSITRKEETGDRKGLDIINGHGEGNRRVQRDTSPRRGSVPLRLSGEEPLPWMCEKHRRWRSLPNTFYPSLFLEVVCEGSSCMGGHFTCRPVTYTTHVLQLCFNSQCDDARTPYSLRHLWRFVDMEVTVDCACSS